MGVFYAVAWKKELASARVASSFLRSDGRRQVGSDLSLTLTRIFFVSLDLRILCRNSGYLGISVP